MKTFYFLLALVGACHALPQSPRQTAGGRRLSSGFPSHPVGPFTVVQDNDDDDHDFEALSPFSDSRQIQPSNRAAFRFNTDLGARSSLGRQHFSVIRESAEDQSVEDGGHFRSAFGSRRDSPEVDDIFSSELFDDSNIHQFASRMSLGRRFHPLGIPKRKDPVNIPASSRTSKRGPQTFSNPHIHSPSAARLLLDDSFEIDDDLFESGERRPIINLSPSVRAFNHQSDDERLAVSKDILNQYNFVDVQGTTNWGYRTDDQYQEHKVHDDGSMVGEFGWTAPEGSEISIKYIADKGGYRVISSTGTQQRDTPAVLLEKEKHFRAHANAKARFNEEVTDKLQGNIRTVASPIPAGVPLPGTSNAKEVPVGRVDSPGGFVVLSDEESFPILTSGGPTGSSFGVPLSTVQSNAGGRNNANTGSIDSAGVPLPPRSFGPSSIGSPSTGSTGISSNSNTGVPLPVNINAAPEFINSKQAPSLRTGADTAFGVPLPAQKPDQESSSLAIGDTNSFGVGLPSGNIDNNQNVGVPLFTEQEFGTKANNVPVATGNTRPLFGVPLPAQPQADKEATPSQLDTGISQIVRTNQKPRAEPALVAPQTPSIFGVPLPNIPESDPVVSSVSPSSGQQLSINAANPSNFGVSLPAITPSQSRNEPSPISHSSVGVPISSLSLGSTDTIMPLKEAAPAFINAGVPLPSNVLSSTSQSTKPEATVKSSLGGPNEIGVGLPVFGKPTQMGEPAQPFDNLFQSTQKTGVALSDIVSATSANEIETPGLISQGAEIPAVGIPLSAVLPPVKKTGRSESEISPAIQSVLNVQTSGGVPLSQLEHTNAGSISPSLEITRNILSSDRASSMASPAEPMNIGVSLSNLRGNIPIIRDDTLSGSAPIQSVRPTVGVALPSIGPVSTSLTPEAESILPAQKIPTSFKSSAGVSLPSGLSDNKPSNAASAGVPLENMDATLTPDQPHLTPSVEVVHSIEPVATLFPATKGSVDTTKTGVSLSSIPEQVKPVRSQSPATIGVSLPVLPTQSLSNVQGGETIPATLPEKVGVSLSSFPSQSQSKVKSATNAIKPIQRSGVSLPNVPRIPIPAKPQSSIPQNVPSRNIGVALRSFPSKSQPKLEAPIKVIKPSLRSGVSLSNAPLASISAEPQPSLKQNIPSRNVGVALPSIPSKSQSEVEAPIKVIKPIQRSGVSLSNAPLPSISAEPQSILKQNIPSRNIGVALPSFPSQSQAEVQAPVSVIKPIQRSGVSLSNAPRPSISEVLIPNVRQNIPSRRIGVALPSFPSRKQPESVVPITRTNPTQRFGVSLSSAPRQSGFNRNTIRPNVRAGGNVGVGLSSFKADQSNRSGTQGQERSFDQLLSLSRAPSASSGAGRRQLFGENVGVPLPALRRRS